MDVMISVQLVRLPGSIPLQRHCYYTHLEQDNNYLEIAAIYVIDSMNTVQRQRNENNNNS